MTSGIDGSRYRSRRPAADRGGGEETARGGESALVGLGGAPLFACEGVGVRDAGVPEPSSSFSTQIAALAWAKPLASGRDVPLHAQIGGVSKAGAAIERDEPGGRVVAAGDGVVACDEAAAAGSGDGAAVACPDEVVDAP